MNFANKLFLPVYNLQFRDRKYLISFIFQSFQTTAKAEQPETSTAGGPTEYPQQQPRFVLGMENIQNSTQKELNM